MLSPRMSVLFDQVKLKRRVIGNEQTKVASPKPADMETDIKVEESQLNLMDC